MSGVVGLCGWHLFNSYPGGPYRAFPRQTLVRFLHPCSSSSWDTGPVVCPRKPSSPASGPYSFPNLCMCSPVIFPVCCPILATTHHAPPTLSLCPVCSPPAGWWGEWTCRTGSAGVGLGVGLPRGGVAPAGTPASPAEPGWPRPASSLTWHQLSGLQPCTSEQSWGGGECAPSRARQCSSSCTVWPGAWQLWHSGFPAVLKPVAWGSALRGSLS